MATSLVLDLDDFETLCEEMQCTVQITFRVKEVPRWLVRIQRKSHPENPVYRQSVDDDLATAIEECYEAWLHDVEASKNGRRGAKENVA